MAAAKPLSLKTIDSLFRKLFMMSLECHTHMITMLMEAQRHTRMSMETGEDSFALVQERIFGSDKQQDMERSLASKRTAQQHVEWKSPRALSWELESKAKMVASTIVSSKMETLVTRLLSDKLASFMPSLMVPALRRQSSIVERNV